MVIELPLWRRLPEGGEAEFLPEKMAYLEPDGFEFDELVEVVDESERFDVLGRLAAAADPDASGVTV